MTFCNINDEAANIFLTSCSTATYLPLSSARLLLVYQAENVRWSFLAILPVYRLAILFARQGLVEISNGFVNVFFKNRVFGFVWQPLSEQSEWIFSDNSDLIATTKSTSIAQSAVPKRTLY
jgi:hypothetical protein